jgi:hypothetical protein
MQTGNNSKLLLGIVAASAKIVPWTPYSKAINIFMGPISAYFLLPSLLPLREYIPRSSGIADSVMAVTNTPGINARTL